MTDRSMRMTACLEAVVATAQKIHASPKPNSDIAGYNFEGLYSAVSAALVILEVDDAEIVARLHAVRDGLYIPKQVDQDDAEKAVLVLQANIAILRDDLHTAIEQATAEGIAAEPFLRTLPNKDIDALTNLDALQSINERLEELKADMQLGNIELRRMIGKQKGFSISLGVISFDISFVLSAAEAALRYIKTKTKISSSTLLSSLEASRAGADRIWRQTTKLKDEGAEKLKLIARRALNTASAALHTGLKITNNVILAENSEEASETLRNILIRSSENLESILEIITRSNIAISKSDNNNDKKRKFIHLFSENSFTFGAVQIEITEQEFKKLKSHSDFELSAVFRTLARAIAPLVRSQGNAACLRALNNDFTFKSDVAKLRQGGIATIGAETTVTPEMGGAEPRFDIEIKGNTPETYDTSTVAIIRLQPETRDVLQQNRFFDMSHALRLFFI